MGRLLNVVTPLHTATKRDYMGRMNDDKIGCSGSEGGQCQPARDIPRLVRLGDGQGELPRHRDPRVRAR